MYKKITPTDNVKIFKDLISGQPDDSVEEPVEDLSKWEEIGALLYTGGIESAEVNIVLAVGTVIFGSGFGIEIDRAQDAPHGEHGRELAVGSSWGQKYQPHTKPFHDHQEMRYPDLLPTSERSLIRFVEVPLD